MVRLVVALLALTASWQALAGVTATVNRLTSDEFSLTFSGTFDADGGGEQADWVAIKNDWSGNYGVNSEWVLGFAQSSTPIQAAPGVTVIEESVLINGLAPTEIRIDGREPYGDSIMFHSVSPITAGMPISGTIHLAGNVLFDPRVWQLEVLTGFDSVGPDWHRLETPVSMVGFVVQGLCGAPGSIDLTGLTPNGPFAVLKGPDLTGSTVPVGGCAGTELALGNVQLVTTVPRHAG